MIDLYTTDQVRAMDERSIARGRTADDRPGASLDLMERAAGHLARAVTDVGGQVYGLRVGIVAGKGNNGGDGVAAARLLLRAGAVPRVCLVGGADDLSDDGTVQLHRYRRAGGRLVDSVAGALEGADVGVDCLLGTGARGEPRPPYREAVAALNACRAPTVACDLPSGVDADSGAVPGVAVDADLTVSLGAHKRGLWLWPARGRCGRLALGDLGIVEPGDEPSARVLDTADVAAAIPPPAPDAHKRSRGVVVAFAGSPGMSGAAVLVARGAMAAGAGLVTVATAASERHVVASAVPEALTVGLPEDDPDAAFERLAAQAEQADALALGPGLGRAPATQALVRRLVAELDVPLVVDADGLNAFRRSGDGSGPTLADHAAPLLVATPHTREFARVAGPSDSDPWADRARVVPDRAKAWDTVIVAKGPGSVIAAPDGRVWVNATGGAALATGGTGDVLTGILVTLVAQRPAPDVVAAGVHLHGLAGQLRAGAPGGLPVTVPDPVGRAARSVTALDVARAMAAAWRVLDDASSAGRRQS